MASTAILQQIAAINDIHFKKVGSYRLILQQIMHKQPSFDRFAVFSAPIRQQNSRQQAFVRNMGRFAAHLREQMPAADCFAVESPHPVTSQHQLGEAEFVLGVGVPKGACPL